MIKNFNLLEKVFSLKTLLWTPRHQIRRPYWIFLPEVANFLQELGNWIGIYVFKIFSNSSRGHVKCNFGNRIEKFPSKFSNRLARSPKMIKKNLYFFQKIIFHLKLFPWTLRLHFWEICWNLLAKSPKGFCSKYDNNEKVFFPKIMFLQLIPLDTQTSTLTSLRKYCRQKLDKFL